MKKIIGITPRLIYEDQIEKQFVNTRYLDFLKLFDLNFLMINLDNPNLYDILSLCDGFLITGGDDINPSLYNQHNTNSLGISDRMDETDLKVIKYAVDNSKPLMGICRGLQVINVFFGGSLHQDIPGHKNTTHEIQVSKTAYCKDTITTVNSYHHQIIDSLGKNLSVFAKHNDIIEGIYHKELPILAVQWHPEINKNNFETNLFKNFIDKHLK